MRMTPQWGEATALVLVLGLTARSDAGLALNIDHGSGTVTSETISAGFSFTTNRAVTVDSLAVFNPGLGSQVRLYDAMGIVLGQATVTAGDAAYGNIRDSGGLPQSFNFRAINPVFLAASSTYYVAADVPGGAFYLSRIGGILTDPAINYSHGVWTVGAGRDPLADELGHGFADGYLGANFGIVSIRAVPEPSSLSFLGVAGIIGLCYIGRRACSRVGGTFGAECGKRAGGP